MTIVSSGAGSPSWRRRYPDLKKHIDDYRKIVIPA